MILLIDNYDSFTYNLVHLIGETYSDIAVHRNDHLTVESAIALKPEAIVLSPGPCTPDEAGICVDLVQAACEHQIPLLGVCLGHQSIAQAFGGTVARAPRLMHGKTSHVSHNDSELFQNISNPFLATRYHSLIVERDSLPNSLEVTATSTDDNLIMAIQHKSNPIFGLQFHPESIASDYGTRLIKNFIHSTSINSRSA